MSYAKYAYTTSDKILTTSKMKLGITTTTMDAALRIYIQQALGEIPSLDLTEYKTATLDICDEPHKMAKLPCGFIRFAEPNAIRFRDNNTGECHFPRTVNNVMFRHSGSYSCRGDIQINNGYIYLDTGVTATEVDIYYLSVLLDENDRMKIPVSHARPIEEYLLYQVYETRGDMNKAVWHQGLWARGKRMVAAKSKLMNVNDKEEWFEISNSLL